MRSSEKEVPELSGTMLFATWDAPTSSYLTSLFAPIFVNLARDYGLGVEVIQATWRAEQGSTDQRQAEILSSEGIAYHSVTINKTLGKAGDLTAALQMYFFMRRFTRARAGRLIIFARSPLVALIAILVAKKNPNAYIVFDADGLPFDERVEYGGMNPLGLVYRLMRDVEAYSIREADAVLVRTNVAIDVLLARAGPGLSRSKFHKVLNGRDEAMFAPAIVGHRQSVRTRLGIPLDAPLLCYVGSSFNGKYQGKAILTLFAEVHAQLPSARLLLVLERTETACDGLSLHSELGQFISVVSATGEEVPALISACDLGLSLIESSYSTSAVSATKVGEYLLCGLPVIVNKGCGEIADKLRDQKFANYLSNVEAKTLKNAAAWFVEDIWPAQGSYATQARMFGIDECGLEKALRDYREVMNKWLRSNNSSVRQNKIDVNV